MAERTYHVSGLNADALTGDASLQIQGDGDAYRTALTLQFQVDLEHGGKPDQIREQLRQEARLIIEAMLAAIN